MTKYDFLESRWMIFDHFYLTQQGSLLTLDFSFLPWITFISGMNFSMERLIVLMLYDNFYLFIVCFYWGAKDMFKSL